jgi:hypothetical protein
VVRTAVANIAINPAFTDTSSSNASRTVTATTAQFIPTVDLFTSPLVGVGPDADGRILLGSVAYTTALSGGAVTLTADDIPDVAGDVVTLNGLNAPTPYSIDAFVVPRELVLVPIPEPAGLLAVAGLAGVVGRRFRRA